MEQRKLGVSNYLIDGLVSGRTENVGGQFKFPRQKTSTPPAVAERGRYPEWVRDRPIIVCQRDCTRVRPKVEVPSVSRVAKTETALQVTTRRRWSWRRVLVVILVLSCPGPALCMLFNVMKVYWSVDSMDMEA